MPQNNNPKGIRTALLSRFSAFGDVAMTVPVIYSACRCYPDVRFVLVTRPSMTSIFVNAPDNLVLVGADVKAEYNGVAGLRRLASRLYADYRPDIFIDLHNVLRTKILGAFLRLKGVPGVQIFKPRAKRRALTRRNNKVMLPLISQRARYREAFFKAGLPLVEKFDGLFQGHATAPDECYAAITTPKPAGQKWIGIAPFAAHNGKVYPVELMEKVVARFQRDADTGRDLRIFLFGGGSREQAILDGWANRYSAATNLAGKRYGFKVELAPRRDAEHGLRQHAHERYRRHSYSEHLGGNSPLLRLQGLAPERLRYAPGASALPPLLGIRRQAMLPRRPAVPQRH